MKKGIFCLILCVSLFVTFLSPCVSAIDLAPLIEQARKEKEEAAATGLDAPELPDQPVDPDSPEDLEDAEEAEDPEDEEDYGDPDRIRTSEEGIELIKSFETYSPKVVRDVGQWAIGYGTQCDPSDYPDGITEEEADKLMRKTLAGLEEYLTRYITRNNLNLSQTQFDAIASMSYNLGTSWISKNYRFWSMLSVGVGSYSANEIASAMCIFCHIGTQVNTAILSRRIREAQLFLYGDYTGQNCPTFRYVVFNGNGGSLDTDVQVYQTGSMYQSFPTVSAKKYYFAGWFTSSGKQLTTDTLVSQNLHVTASWSDKPVAAKKRDYHFVDIKSTDWFAPYVVSLYEDGIVGGYTDNTFRPLASVSTGEALKMILLAIGFSEQPAVDGHWAGGYQQMAYECGFLDETDLENGLNALASRGLIAKLTANALGLRRSGDISPFADSDDDSVVALFQANIIDGTYDSITGKRLYHPGDPIKRSELAKIVWTLNQTLHADRA